MRKIHDKKGLYKPADLQNTPKWQESIAAKSVLSEGLAGNSSLKFHKGMKVLTKDEFNRLYGTETDEKGVRTFDFQGYVEKEDGSLRYTDVLIVKGLKGKLQINAHGVFDYHDHDQRNIRMEGPEDVREYVVYITIPSETQKQENVVCQYDSCMSLVEYLQTHQRDEMLEAQNKKGWVVEILQMDPVSDSDAREKLKMFITKLTAFIQGKQPLDQLNKKIKAVENEVLNSNPA